MTPAKRGFMIYYCFVSLRAELFGVDGLEDFGYSIWLKEFAGWVGYSHRAHGEHRGSSPRAF